MFQSRLPVLNRYIVNRELDKRPLLTWTSDVMYTICTVSQRSHSTSRPWYKEWHAVIPHSELHIGTGGGRLNEGEGDDMDVVITFLVKHILRIYHLVNWNR